jgi:hypothetical protein
MTMPKSLSLPDDLTPEEASAIRALDRLANRWPESLMIASMAGTLCVLRCNEDGSTPMSGTNPSADSFGLDREAVVYTTNAIHNTGGDW